MRYVTILTIVLPLVLTGCTSPGKATETLHKSGYTEVEITGYDMFACGKDDDTSTGFRAKNPAGQVVEGTVCCSIGPFSKACTVRF